MVVSRTRWTVEAGFWSFAEGRGASWRSKRSSQVRVDAPSSFSSVPSVPQGVVIFGGVGGGSDELVDNCAGMEDDGGEDFLILHCWSTLHVYDIIIMSLVNMS